MSAPVKHQSYPLAMRLPPSDVAVIDRAARLKGRSRTDFVREAAVREAEAVILDNTVLSMSSQGFADFMEALDRPATAPDGLVRLFRRAPPAA